MTKPETSDPFDTGQPLLVVGMHRSGTTLLVEILEKLGVFMGSDQSRNRESRFFQTLNREALDFFGSSWRHLDHLPHVSQLGGCAWLGRYVSSRLRESFDREFVGGSPNPERGRWGWKDPRSSLLLPVWHQIFPGATIVHIYRDGRDVALSLLDREIKRAGKSNLVLNEDERRDCYLSFFQLWESYEKRIREALGLFPTRWTLRFEDLLSDPENELRKLGEFLRLDATRSMHVLISTVDRSKSGRHRRNEAGWTRDIPLDDSLLRELRYL